MFTACIVPMVNWAPFVDLCPENKPTYDEIDQIFADYVLELMKI